MSTMSNRRRSRAIAAAATIGLTAVIAAPSQAAPVEYVKVCSLYGAGFFYIPGTDTCTNANQIATNQFDIARAQTRASTGTAMAASLVAPPRRLGQALQLLGVGCVGRDIVAVPTQCIVLVGPHQHVV